MPQTGRAPVLGVPPPSDPARGGKQGSPFTPRQPGHCPGLKLSALWRNWLAPKADNLRVPVPFPATSPTLTKDDEKERKRGGGERETDRQTDRSGENVFFNPLHPDTTFSPTFTPIPQANSVPHPQLNLPTSRNPLTPGGGARESPKPGGKARADKKEARAGGDPGARETKGEREKASHRGVSSMET